MDFVGAAQSEGEPAIINLSSDEDDSMDCASTDSVEDLISSSEEEAEDVELIARCIEGQLAELIPIPTAGAAKTQNSCGTPRPNQPLFLTFSQSYFNLGRGNGPLTCDDRVRNNHPINICRNLIPQVDTPLSPPIADRRLDYGSSAPSRSYSDDTVSVESH